MDLSIEEQKKRALAIAGISVALFFIGFLISSEGGADVEAARNAGAKAGQAAGAKKGKQAGYVEGFEKGEETAYKAAYSKAYRQANPGGDAGD